MSDLRVYLAGPDVFLPDPNEYFFRMKQRCAERGLVGVPPSDGGLSKGFTGTLLEIADRIKRENVGIIKTCHAIAANLQPFRHPVEPDPGTVWETGFGDALGKVVAGYLPEANLTYASKVARHFGTQQINGKTFCRDYGMLIEDFGLPLNLMLARSMPLFTTAEEAFDNIAERLHAAPRPAVIAP